MDLRLETSERDGWTIVAAAGEIDISVAPMLRAELIGLIGGGVRRLVVDLTWTDFIDSTGLGVLIGSLKRIRSHDGEMALIITDPRVFKVFEITGLNQIFAIHATVELAVAS